MVASRCRNTVFTMFFLPAFLGFFLISPVYWVKINWMMPAYITGVIFLTMFISQKSVKINIIVAAALHLVLAIEVIFYPIPIKSDHTWFGWEELSFRLLQVQKTYPNTFIFSDDSYKTTAELNFFLLQNIYAQNILQQPALHFDYVGDNLHRFKELEPIIIKNGESNARKFWVYYCVGYKEIKKATEIFKLNQEEDI